MKNKPKRDAKGYAQGIKNTYEVVIPDKLKQFAERLKDRLRYTSSTSDVLELSGLEFDGVEVEQCIDETLKEFIDE